MKINVPKPEKLKDFANLVPYIDQELKQIKNAIQDIKVYHSFDQNQHLELYKRQKKLEMIRQKLIVQNDLFFLQKIYKWYDTLHQCYYAIDQSQKQNQNQQDFLDHFQTYQLINKTFHQPKLPDIKHDCSGWECCNNDQEWEEHFINRPLVEYDAYTSLNQHLQTYGILDLKDEQKLNQIANQLEKHRSQIAIIYDKYHQKMIQDQLKNNQNINQWLETISFIQNQLDQYGLPNDHNFVVDHWAQIIKRQQQELGY